MTRGPDVPDGEGDLARPPGEWTERCPGPGSPVARRLCVPCPLVCFRPRRGPREDTLPPDGASTLLTGRDAETRTCPVPRHGLRRGQPCDQGRTPGFPEDTSVKLVASVRPSSQASSGTASRGR